MAEGARLESVYTATYRGFESPPHRHIQKKSSYESTGFFFTYCTYCGGMRTHDRGSTTGGSQLDRPRTQRAGCPQGERSESIPPSPPYLKKSPYESTGFFFVYCTHRVPPPTSVRARGNCAHQLSGYSVNNQNAQDSREHICVIWSLPVTSSLIKMPPTEIHVTCHHKIVMPEESTMEKIVN